MTTNQTQADWQKTALRLPRELHKQIHDAAKQNHRTFNGQIVALLSDYARNKAHEVAHA
jgi:hypothetical protein